MDFYIHFPTQKMRFQKVTLGLIERKNLILFAVPGVRVLNGSKLISQEIKVSDVHLWFHDFYIQDNIAVYLATKREIHTLLLVQTNNPTAIIDSQFPLIEGKSYLFYIPSDHPYSLKLAPGAYHFFQIELGLTLMDKMARNNLSLQSMLKEIKRHPLKELLYHSGFVDVQMQHTLRELRESIPADGTERLLFLEEKTLQLMRFFSQQWTKEQAASQFIQQKEQELIDIGNYIRAHLGQELSSSILAVQFHKSERSLTRQFKHFYGITLYQFILNERMNYAAFLLSLEKYNINEIVVLTGFEHVFSFRRAFKQHFNMTPSSFIKNRKRKE